MDASSRYLVERMLNDVQFLLDQGHIQRSQATAIRSSLTPLLDQNPLRVADSSPRSAGPPLPTAAPAASSSSVSLASATKSSKVPPPPPASSSSSAFSPRNIAGAALAEGNSPYPPSYSGGVASASSLASVHAQLPPPDYKHKHAEDLQEEWAKALWSFDASGGEDELRFEVGEEIRVLERLDENWWKGRIGGAGAGASEGAGKGSVEAREGVFPSSYVELIPTPTPMLSSASTEKARLGAGQRQWSAPKARFSSSPAPGPAKPYGYPQSGSSYQPQGANQHQPQTHGYGYGPPQQGPAGLQPVVTQPASEEERAKRQGQVKNFLKTPVGTAVASGVGFGVGASLVSNIL